MCTPLVLSQAWALRSSGYGQYETGISCINLESTCGLHKSKKVVVVCLSYCQGGSNSQPLKCQSLVSLHQFANIECGLNLNELFQGYRPAISHSEIPMHEMCVDVSSKMWL